MKSKIIRRQNMMNVYYYYFLQLEKIIFKDDIFCWERRANRFTFLIPKDKFSENNREQFEKIVDSMYPKYKDHQTHAPIFIVILTDMKSIERKKCLTAEKYFELNNIKGWSKL